MRHAETSKFVAKHRANSARSSGWSILALPWREMNDLRNVLIHNYDGADPAMVWGVVERQIPEVLIQVSTPIEELGRTEAPVV